MASDMGEAASLSLPSPGDQLLEQVESIWRIPVILVQLPFRQFQFFHLFIMVGRAKIWAPISVMVVLMSVAWPLLAAEVQHQQQDHHQQQHPSEMMNAEPMSRGTRSTLSRAWRNMQQRQQRAATSFYELPTAVQLELLQRLSKGQVKKNSRAENVRWQLIKRGISGGNYSLLKRLIQPPDGTKRGATSSSLVHSFLGMRGKKSSQLSVADDDLFADDTYADGEIDDGNYPEEDEFKLSQEGQ